MQIIVCFDAPLIPTTYVYIGDTDCIWQAVNAKHKRIPKLFNMFEAKKLIKERCANTNINIKYYTKVYKG